jgi:carbonic anhydrase/acetyltransferase-like protein (isoleucine patch superfamily)
MLFTLAGRRVELRGHGHFVAPNATHIGRVILEDRASVWFNVVIRGDNDPIVIGARSNVQDASVLHTDDGVPLTLGEDVSVGHAVGVPGKVVRSLTDEEVQGLHDIAQHYVENARRYRNSFASDTG